MLNNVRDYAFNQIMLLSITVKVEYCNSSALLVNFALKSERRVNSVSFGSNFLFC